MNKYLYHIVIAVFFIGIIMGMMNFKPVLPVSGDLDSPIYYGIRGKSYISLTFNVDWGEEYIPAILTTLKNNNVRATFFITGGWAEKFPELVREIVNSGHELGNHGYRHQHLFQLNDRQLQELILRNEELLLNITGKRTNLFAPPYGEVNEKICRVAANLGHRVIMWSADTIDWQRPSSLVIEQRAVNKIEDGGIILMHPTSPSHQALSGIISKLNTRGFKFVTISQLIGEDDINEN